MNPVPTEICYLRYQSRLGRNRPITRKIVHTEVLRRDEMIVAVPSSASRSRYIHMHYHRLTGEVFLLRDGARVTFDKRNRIVIDKKDRNHVGINAELVYL